MGNNAIEEIVLQTIAQDPSTWKSSIEWFVLDRSKEHEPTTRGAARQLTTVKVVGCMAQVH